jgi:arylsulfatase A-like enzyme
MTGAYVAIVLATALNVPVARFFATPLTASMLTAAGGALADSVLGYVNLSNALGISVILGVGLLLARRRLPALGARPLVVLGSVLGVLAIAGAVLARRVDTLGLHRNAVSALGLTALARMGTPSSGASVAELPPEGEATDLAHLAGAARGRNVIWIILESTAAQYLGTYGARPAPTPELDHLSQHAVVLDFAYSAYPESIKGLFSMLCSTAPGAYTDAADYTQARSPCRSIAQVLKEAGYRTAFFHSGRFRYLGMQGIVDGRGFDELHDAATIGGAHVSSFGTDDASTVARTLAFVDRVGVDAPFFAVYSPISGHHPYKSPGTGPRPFAERSEHDRYLNDLYAGDAAFGELVRGIRERGLAQRTLFVVVGDHGEAFEQHPGNVAHTLHVYEENVRVPMIYAAPGLTTKKLRARQIASLIDMAPTTLALLGLPIPESYQGRSLLEPRPGVARFFTDHAALELGLRQGKFKFLLDTEHGRARLFDLESDPAEQRDIAGSHAERTERYRRHLLDWSEAQRARLRTQAR